VGDRAAWALLFLMLSLSKLILDDRTIYGNEDALQPFLTGMAGLFIRLGPLGSCTSGSSSPKCWPSIEDSLGSNGL
jgi:hypothetical protein